jgi:D-beta-D-heptose 7-phosphate kinase/D-beta-D-heptose 1-phosphate adenosyltransferase
MINKISAKIRDSRDSLGAQVRDWQAAGEKVVFTNGCFDLLHYGHLVYLAEARGLGDRLVIGLNSDASVRRLKGAERPIWPEECRLFQLASLACVDAVVLFEEDTPLELLQVLQPDVLVKGGDYQLDQIVGADLVLGRGGQVQSLSFVEGYSSSGLIEKIRRL